MKLLIMQLFTASRYFLLGRAIAQAVSRRLPTAAARFRSHFTDCCTLIMYHPGAGRIGQLVADVPSGLSLTPHPKELKKT
jgi:hypothetical protein